MDKISEASESKMYEEYLDPSKKFKAWNRAAEDRSCKTCTWRTGSRCNKNDFYTEDDDWCSAYRKEKNNGE